MVYNTAQEFPSELTEHINNFKETGLKFNTFSFDNEVESNQYHPDALKYVIDEVFSLGDAEKLYKVDVIGLTNLAEQEKNLVNLKIFLNGLSVFPNIT